MVLDKIKLIIWDLDETFWNGTLSDGDVVVPQINIKFINDLIDKGIMCSICSKNDSASVEKELRKYSLWDMFVFKSINWSPKGERVKQIIDEMQLRAVNTLFIDDNNLNLAEAKSSCPGINTMSPSDIPQLMVELKSLDKKDLSHERLKQYKILEMKKEFKATTASNEEFLFKSNIKVSIKYDVINHIDRIEDLIQRSNQLNFTKIRSTKEELLELCDDKNILTGYVEVSDNFGDYGIVGFFACRNNSLLHFVFSCRTLNMGVEQYVYKTLNKPQIKVVGEVASDLDAVSPKWINQPIKKNNNKMGQITKKILLKGPCDMEQIFSFIEDSKYIDKEFVFVNKENGVSIEQYNHTYHIVQSKTLTSEQKAEVVKELKFSAPNMYDTKLFSDEYSVVFLSLFTDPNLGLYKRKGTNIITAFAEYTNDLTDAETQKKYINGEVFCANCKFTKLDLESFSKKYEFIGRITPDQILTNVKFILENMNPTMYLCLILGSTTPYVKETKQAYFDRAQYNKELNRLIYEYAEQNKRVKIIDVNNYLSGQEDFTNNINHFAKRIYCDMSHEIIKIVEELGNRKLKNKSKFKIFIEKIYSKIKGIIKKIFSFGKHV